MSEDVNLDSPEYLNWDSRDENVQKEQDRVVTAKKRRAVAYHDIFSKTDLLDPGTPQLTIKFTLFLSNRLIASSQASVGYPSVKRNTRGL